MFHLNIFIQFLSALVREGEGQNHKERQSHHWRHERHHDPEGIHSLLSVRVATHSVQVKPDGTAHVKKVVFKEPENVDVKGSLSNNKPRTLRTLKNSVNKMRPLAAIRILKTARYVLKSPSAGN